MKSKKTKKRISTGNSVSEEDNDDDDEEDSDSSDSDDNARNSQVIGMGVSEERLFEAMERFHSTKVMPALTSIHNKLDNHEKAMEDMEEKFDEKLGDSEAKYEKLLSKLIKEQAAKLTETTQMYERQVRALMRV